VPPLITFD
jgi:NAD+ kinase